MVDLAKPVTVYSHIHQHCSSDAGGWHLHMQPVERVEQKRSHYTDIATPDSPAQSWLVSKTSSKQLCS